MIEAPPIRGLYAIADTAVLDRRTWPAQVEAALAGGARLIQYRDKQGTERDRRRDQARAVAALAARHGALCIVNDDPQLARDAGAHGVHLGRDDPGVAEARALLGPGAVIGVSCYDDLERARQAERAGADYVAFGSFFPSPSKPDAVRAGVALLAQARARLGLPIVAIGGITPDNAPALIAAGADAVAVISAVFAQPDIEAAARRFALLFGGPGRGNRS